MTEHNGGNPPASYQGIHRLSHSELAELTPPVLNAAYARQTTGLACQSFLNSEPEKTGRRPKSDTAKAATFGAVDRSIIDSFITCMVDDEVFARTIADGGAAAGLRREGAPWGEQAAAILRCSL
jgi:hypothetical protein